MPCLKGPNVKYRCDLYYFCLSKMTAKNIFLDLYLKLFCWGLLYYFWLCFHACWEKSTQQLAKFWWSNRSSWPHRQNGQNILSLKSSTVLMNLSFSHLAKGSQSRPARKTNNHCCTKYIPSLQLDCRSYLCCLLSVAVCVLCYLVSGKIVLLW